MYPPVDDTLPPSRISRLKSVLSYSKIARYAIISSLVQMCIQLILEICVATNHIWEYSILNPIFQSPEFPPSPVRDVLESQRNLARAVTVYHVIYMLASVMHLYITVDSVIHQNSIELIALSVINAGLFGYSIVQQSQSYDIFSQINLTLQAVPPNLMNEAGFPKNGNLDTSSVFYYPAIVVSLLFFLGTLVISYKLHQEYGWAIYKRIGADTGLRRQMMHYFFLMMLLKLDVFFYFTFSLQFLVVSITFSQLAIHEIIIHLVVALCMIVGLIVICIKALREENETYIFTFMTGTIVCGGYLFWKLYQAFSEDRFRFVRKSITFSITSCLLLAMLTLFNAFICYRNFGQGLKRHLLSPNRNTTDIQQNAELGTVRNSSGSMGKSLPVQPMQHA